MPRVIYQVKWTIIHPTFGGHGSHDAAQTTEALKPWLPAEKVLEHQQYHIIFLVVPKHRKARFVLKLSQCHCVWQFWALLEAQTLLQGDPVSSQ